jgi:hypothetical protein
MPPITNHPFVNIGEYQMKFLPSSSHDVPMKRFHPPKADLRREATAWRVLVWTYRDEKAQWGFDNGAGRHRLPGLAQCSLGREWAGAGFDVDAPVEAHEDALLVDGKLRGWCEGDRTAYDAIVACAEKATMMAEEPVVELLKAVPRRDKWGEPAVIYTLKGRRPYLCEVEYCGLSEEEAGALRDRHARSLALLKGFLGVMGGFGLTRWKIIGAS